MGSSTASYRGGVGRNAFWGMVDVNRAQNMQIEPVQGEGGEHTHGDAAILLA